ncbi:PQQ-binding-like beta-propeller repeat protein [Methanoregula sp.]|uniref:outer membrane protein assembly factor BamB family protein n=1 Tax=Methanoregula sp. TaxID=2052170 RepID=UPI00236DD172|nr:PQQ-binding-like beta-propeller repeat protein [Methanoregula sp.]MDD1687544.1 PQQ-like beta-propeller repeat protein [Methanoregula sp.]
MFRANPEHTGVYGNGGNEPGNSELWHFATGGFIYSSPTVADGIVYAGSDDKNLYAIDAVTGKEKWRFATGDWVDSSPAVANGIVYVGSNDKNLYAIGTNASSLTTAPTTISSTRITLPRTTIQQTIASTQTTSPVRGQNANPTVALPVLAIIVTIILFAGGGCLLNRVKNKP